MSNYYTLLNLLKEITKKNLALYRGDSTAKPPDITILEGNINLDSFSDDGSEANYDKMTLNYKRHDESVAVLRLYEISKLTRYDYYMNAERAEQKGLRFLSMKQAHDSLWDLRSTLQQVTPGPEDEDLPKSFVDIFAGVDEDNG